MSLTIENFIASGWYTAPMKGVMTRTPEGKKTGGVYLKGWQKHREVQSQIQSRLALGLTGRESGVIAIDCDTNEAFIKISQLIGYPYRYAFMPANDGVTSGFEKGGGTYCFRYTDRLKKSFSINDSDNNIAIDVLSNGKSVLLPLEDNKTKQYWEPHWQIPQLATIPDAVLDYLLSFEKSSVGDSNVASKFNLRPMVLKQLELSPSDCLSPLWERLTPKAYRDGVAGHTPTQVGEGQRSVYLSKVSGILGADNSISPDLYLKMMEWVNLSLPHPLSKEELESTITVRMVNGEAIGADGNPIWSYQPHAEHLDHVFTYTSRVGVPSIFGQSVETREYVIVDLEGERAHTFNNRSTAKAELTSDIGDMSMSDFNAIVSAVEVETNFELEFGEMVGVSRGRIPIINIYAQSDNIKILRGRQNAEVSGYPGYTIKLFESLIPDVDIRQYVFRFLRKRLSTGINSPIFIQLVGVAGSGKGIFTKVLSELVGVQYTHSVSVQDMLGQFSGWMKDKQLLIFDELGEISTKQQRGEMKGKLKAITGGELVNIREMYKESTYVRNNALIVFTSNIPVIDVDSDDRRMLTWHAPNILKDESWVINSGGMVDVYNKIIGEVPQFAQWLRDHVDEMDDDEYITPPTTQYKESLYIQQLSKFDKLVQFISLNNWLGVEALLDTAMARSTLFTGRISSSEDRYCNSLYFARSGEIKIPLDNIYHLYKMWGGDLDKYEIVTSLSAKLEVKRGTIGGDAGVKYILVNRQLLTSKMEKEIKSTLQYNAMGGN